MVIFPQDYPHDRTLWYAELKTPPCETKRNPLQFHIIIIIRSNIVRGRSTLLLNLSIHGL